MISIDEQKISRFMSLFRGRTDVYARRWEKDGISGYSPAYEFDWNKFMVHKRRGGSLKDFEEKRLLPLTKDVIKNHLLGIQVIGIYPALPDSASYFIAADFDGESWRSDSIAFFDECIKVGLYAYLERSRSGNGGHMWIFFSEPVPCYKGRQIGLELIRRAFKISEFEKEVSFDRFFPNQDSIVKGGLGNLIALPLQGKSIVHGNTVFIDLETGNPYLDQWKLLEEVKRHSLYEIDTIYQRLFAEKSICSVSNVST
jgi:hypothetical protein